ncbi:MAG TPA: glycosyltransferase family 4 protein [Solirubrobacteraceae bacterium]|jgi:glycosyltransferase involved in cell wall biosynthesis|nr:glycosyltransferase family 4 protein [Solirubrobacteraceae bacterium]
MPAGRPLRIAWLGGGPAETGGAPGVVTELLDGLTRRGHTIDCFLPATPRDVPEQLQGRENLTFVSADSSWRYNRWYSRTKLTSFASGLFARAFSSLRLRREIVKRHEQQPYDLVYQNQAIESLGVPASVIRSVPLALRPDSHQAGELRWLIAERRLAFRCQPRHVFFVVAAIMSFRTLVQAVRIRRVDLLIAISSVFRDHIVHDYRFPLERTTVITNPARTERFNASTRAPSEPAVVLVPTRLSMRKGLEDIAPVARLLRERGVDVRLRVIGGPSVWSDYTKLLEDLPPENTEYGGRILPQQMPQELQRADIVLVPSKYDPCPVSVLEALVSGVPVIGTSEVGSIEGIDRTVAAEVAPGDVEGIADAVAQMLARLRAAPVETRSLARSEAERRFARDVVCGQISDALEALVERHAAQTLSSARGSRIHHGISGARRSAGSTPSS